jgi:SAM-dependent methyltransferase
MVRAGAAPVRAEKRDKCCATTSQLRRFWVNLLFSDGSVPDAKEVVVTQTTFSERFPRSAKYHPDWIAASVGGAAHALWMTEWLTEALDLRPGMRVLDLGCGRAASSIFLHREFGVQVWATDLWFSADENWRRIRDAGVDHGVFPIHADARSLPFAADFFDAIISIDSFFYYGTDDLYLNYLEHLRAWWTPEPELWCLHSAEWWRRHWQRAGIVEVSLADALPDGWQVWLDWHRVIAPNNSVEIEAVEADRGRYIGYVRAVGRRTDMELNKPVVSVPTEYTQRPLLRGKE